MKGKLNIHDFYCTQCGKKTLPVPRKLGQLREAGHLKKLFCCYCGKENNCVEVNPMSSKYTYEDFLFEFDNGNFNEDGTRKMKYGIFKSHLA